MLWWLSCSHRAGRRDTRPAGTLVSSGEAAESQWESLGYLKWHQTPQFRQLNATMGESLYDVKSSPLFP